MPNKITPMEVSLSLDKPNLERGAFHNICFITESDFSPRTLKVEKLKDLLDNGFRRNSLAYNFCVGVFSQNSVNNIYIRSKRTNESYEDAFRSDDNSQYYFIVIESKDLGTVSRFSGFINSVDDYKLLFYSGSEVLPNSKVSHYYQESPYLDSDNPKNYYVLKSYVVGGERGLDIPLTDESGNAITDETSQDLIVDYKDEVRFYKNLLTQDGVSIGNELGIDLGVMTYLTFYPPDSGFHQTARLAYPEAAWIGLCGNNFPSEMQWLYKNLKKVNPTSLHNVKNGVDFSLSSTTSVINNNTVTVGSGSTLQGIPIHEQVMSDWIKWAISKKVWNTLYNKERLTNLDKDLIINDVRNVLDIAVDRGAFEKYRVTDVNIKPQENTISVKFDTYATQTILGTEVSGSLNY